MYKIRAKSNIVLAALSAVSLLAFLAVENGKVNVRQKWYNEKMEAAKLSQTAAEFLKNNRLEKGVFVDPVNDPNQTELIGQEFTLITTDRGEIEAKLSSTNPNFAAVIVQLLKDAGLHSKDNVAIAFTGSFPALNISVLAAIETLRLNPIIISSVGASSFGATDPHYTWLDMETTLYQAKIFSNRSVAASLGGNNDIGRGLSPEGRNLIEKAIERNDVELIYERHLENSIARRMEIYKEYSNNKPIKAYINVGGGIASLGNSINGKLIPSGLTEYLPMKNFPVRGVMIQMGQKGIPIIHLLNLEQLLTKFDLPLSPVPLPDPGDGGIFVKKIYNVTLTAVATFILVLVIILVYISEQKHHRLGTDVVPPTSVQIIKNQNNNEIPVI
jgi:poly-gamma-glutamate system protein